MSITSTDSATLSSELDRLEAQYIDLRAERRRISETLRNEELSSDERRSLIELRDFTEIILGEVEREIPVTRKMHRRAERRERALKRARFKRPSNWFVGLFNRLLGPLPEGLNAYQPTDKNLRKIRSYRLLGFLLLIGAITLLVSLCILMPWLAISPASLITTVLAYFMPPAWAQALTLPICIGAAVVFTRGLRKPHYQGKLLDGAAMWEEQWFRTGAESWTKRQRLFSCIAFGTVHVINIIYPLASLLVISLLGGVLMFVYLREYRRSGSTRRATYAAAKLHATYNRFAFLYMIIAASLGLILPLLP